ncbi:Cysteine desulfurase [Mycena indigotica]|uniref:Cysteine desulfurase n=1 Tax=Mycena indigotica TaxID=2126181 RepID=A0A8H6RXP7_9AGAR|nr:Cysteine desulfurase [Mycena indigotica]KAF7289234.1 Cysteine desulfurase [Mycena indigotica]
MGHAPSSHRKSFRIPIPCTSTAKVALDTVASDDDSSSIFNSKARYKSQEREKADNHDSPPPSPKWLPLPTYAPGHDSIPTDALADYKHFLAVFPEYRLTWILDTLRRNDYRRLKGETYVDYMGGALHPDSLLYAHTEFLSQTVLGNTHSVSNSSKLSLKCADEARSAVLSFFHASSEDYAVIFTSNATGALKLVGEAFPFSGGGSYVLACDSHNSVHGIREFAASRGARVSYIPATSTGGFDPPTAKNILLRNRPRAKNTVPSLFALTGQSNITNTKAPLSVLEYAKSLGYYTLLDAAALAASSSICLTGSSIDAMAISFYKMFGYPTGIGALVIKKSFLAKLERPWFAGGTVDIVQVPGSVRTRSTVLHEQFEDGTINYLLLPSVTNGLRFLSAYLPFLPLRLSCLMHYLLSTLSQLHHEFTNTPVVRILSATPSRRLGFVGEQADTGSLISLVFLSPSGKMLPLSFIEHAATSVNISLRTGCMCNPGGAAALLGYQEEMNRLSDGVSLAEFTRTIGHELGVVRISLGLASNFQDVWNVTQFVRLLAHDSTRSSLWQEYELQKEGDQVGLAI